MTAKDVNELAFNKEGLFVTVRTTVSMIHAMTENVSIVDGWVLIVTHFTTGESALKMIPMTQIVHIEVTQYAG